MLNLNEVTNKVYLFCGESQGEIEMKNVRFSRNGVEFEPTKQELKIVLDDYAKKLGERDKRIKVLEKALELACANHPAVCDNSMDCNNGVDCVGCLIEHYKAEARKELENE